MSSLLRLPCAILPFLFLFVALARGAQPPSADEPLVDESLRQSIQDRNYPAAVAAIDKLLQRPSAHADYLLYLKGRALFFQQQYDAAAAQFGQLAKQFPESPWARRARFATGVALAKKGDFRAAELIYRAEAESLLSAARKQELADIYLEYADAFFQPPKASAEPDYKAAADFYRKALEAGPLPEKRREAELRVARCLEHLKKTAEAAKLYAQFVHDHPDAPQTIEARYRLGACLLQDKKLTEARRAWQGLLAAHPDSQSERVPEAAFQISRTWNLPQPETAQQLRLGVAALEAFLQRFPAHKLASQAHVDIAKSYVHRERAEDAAKRLTQLLADQRLRDREEIPAARNLLGQCCRLQGKYADAVAAWREYLAKHPADAQWSSVQQEVINTEYLIGLEKYRARDFAAARQSLSDFLARYPLDRRAPGILFLFGQMQAEQKQWDAAIADWRRTVSKYPGSNEASQAQFLIAGTLERELGKPEEALEEYRKLNWGGRTGDAQAAVNRLIIRSLTLASDRVFRSDETPTLRLTTRNIESVTVRAYKLDLETYFRKMHSAANVESLDIGLIDPDATFEYKIPRFAKYQELVSAVPVPLPDGAKCGAMAVTVSSRTLEATTLVLQSDLEIVIKASGAGVFVFAENMLTGRPWPGVKLLFSDGEKVFAEPATGKDGVYQGAAEELQTATDLRVLALSDGHVASNVVGFGESRSAEALADKGYLYTDRPVYRAGQRVAVRGCLRPVKNNAYVVEAGQVCQLDVRDPRDRTLWEQSLTVSPFGTIHTDFRLPPTSPAGEYRVQVSDKQGRSYQGSFRVAEYKLEPVRLRMETPRRVYYRGEEITGTIRAAYHHGAPLASREIKYQLGDEPTLTGQTDSQGLVRFKLATREFAESQILPLKVSVPEWIVQTSFNFHLAVEEYSIHVSTPRDVFVAGEPFFVTIKTTDAAGQATAQKLKLRVLELTGAEGPVGERTVQESAVETTADGTARPLLKLDQGGRFRVRAEGIDRFGNAISGQHDVRLSDRQDHVRLRVLTDRFTFRAGDTAELLVHWRESPALALVTCEAEKVLRHQFVELKPGTNKVPVTMTPDLAPNFEWAVCVMTDRRDKAAVGQASGAPGGWGGASKPSDRAERPAATPQCCGVAVGGLGQGSAGHAPPQAPGGTADKEPRTATGSEPKSAVRFHEASVPLTVENALHVRVSCPGIVHPGQPAAVTVTTTDPQGKPIAAEVSLALIEGRLRERFSALSSMPRPARQQGAADDPFAERPSEPSAQTMFESKLPSLTELFRGHPRHRLVNTSSSIAFGCRPNTHSIPPRVLTEEGRAEITQQNDELLRWSRRPDGPQSAAPDGGGTAGGSSRPAGPAAPSADFDALIELIRKTVAPSWGGGPGATAGEEVGDLGRLVCQTQTNPAPSAGAVAPGRRPGTSDAADRQPDETGHWSPAVVTGADGLAVVQIAVPDRATAWTLFATGITKDTLAGEATAEFVAKKDLFGQLKLPTAFTVGDEAELLAVVHNDAIAKGSLEVTLAIRIGQRTTQVRRTLEVTSRGVHEIPFPVSLRQADQPAGPKSALPAATEVLFELTVAAGERRDVLRRRVPLLPDGMTVAATTGGVADASTTIWVEPPAGVPLQSPRLSLVISPSVDRSLLAVVFGGGADTPSGAAALGEGPETDHPGMVDGTLPRESPARKGSGVGRRGRGRESFSAQHQTNRRGARPKTTPAPVRRSVPRPRPRPAT